MTQEVSDERLGRLARQQYDWFRRVREGSLDPEEVAHAVQQIIDRPFNMERIRIDIFNTYHNDLDIIRKDVLGYINVVLGMDDKNPGTERGLCYMDPEDEKIKPLFDEYCYNERYVSSVEGRLGLNSKETKESFRITIKKIYGQKIATDPNYDFMDQEHLVRAVTEVRLNSDLAGVDSLAAVLSNKTNEEKRGVHNRVSKIYSRVIEGLIKQGYSRSQAQKAIEHFCAK